MKDRIRTLVSDALPAVDVDADFLFAELDSLGVATILLLLSQEFGVSMDATDVTPKNFRSIDSLAQMVASKLNK